jgi:hypothetical protein
MYIILPNRIARIFSVYISTNQPKKHPSGWLLAPSPRNQQTGPLMRPSVAMGTENAGQSGILFLLFAKSVLAVGTLEQVLGHLCVQHRLQRNVAPARTVNVS